MSKNLEMMKKLLEEKKAKGKVKEGKQIPHRYGTQSPGAGVIHKR